MAYYKRRRRGYPKGYATSYRSSRPITGMYRSSSRLMLRGRARRVLSKRGLRSALYSLAEHKFRDTNFIFSPTAGNAVTDNGQMIELTEPPQGLADVQRIGDKATGISLEIKMLIQNPIPPYAITQTDHYTLRCIVFIWRDDTVPVLYDIIQNYVMPAATPDVIQPLNHDKMVKRKILYDKTIVFSSHTDGFNMWTMDHSAGQYRMFFKLSTMKRGLNVINFQGGSETGVNKIYCLLLSDQPANVACYNIAFTSRWNFVDM